MDNPMKYLSHGSTCLPSIKGSIARIFCGHIHEEYQYFLIVQFDDDKGNYSIIAKCADDYASQWFTDALKVKLENDYCGENHG